MYSFTSFATIFVCEHCYFESFCMLLIRALNFAFALLVTLHTKARHFKEKKKQRVTSNSQPAHNQHMKSFLIVIVNKQKNEI